MEHLPTENEQDWLVAELERLGTIKHRDDRLEAEEALPEWKARKIRRAAMDQQEPQK